MIDDPHTDADTPEGLDPSTVEQLLTTTRSVRRRLDLDRPVPPGVIQRCLQMAAHAPSANNVQTWRWIVVTDQDKRQRIAELYRYAWQAHSAAIGGSARRRSRVEAEAHRRTLRSAQWLADNLDRVPVHVLPCVAGRPPSEAESAQIQLGWDRDAGKLFGPDSDRSGTPEGVAALLRNAMYFGSIFPAIWSFQLALRGCGLGSTMTMVHLPFAREVAELLGIPSLVTQICLLPTAYTRGTDFAPAGRRDAEGLTYWNGWNGR
jgi:nitroreductase